MTIKHTPEPWGVHQDASGDVFISSAETSFHIAEVGSEDDETAIPDARRIVACVNACRNLSNDELEQKGLVTSISARFLAAERSRDELLAALELMVAIHDEPSGFSGKYGKALDDAIQAQEEKIDERLLMARTAIAKAKGGAA
ncbi:hypothetical protein ACW5WK_02500 [Aeromonas enteropelogenes]|uniref:hypothetical protein n=1 Tax=Aeromonas enteropelogenes TaxID=29489 RepID=UPI0005A7A9C4|nr:hypothetical protein [Aeromonas enteropelogenes]UBH56247.1 hypothetical protein LA341_20630 [Aeromonas enteropelogenes]